jgi:tRNA (mo5U34)-methyltransferase
MESKYTQQQTIDMVAKHQRWYHEINVGHGITTPGGHDSNPKLKHIEMPADLTGWSVLDIGANDGFFSFTAEERGAERVLATDYPHWTGDVEYYEQVPPRKGHFETARELRGSTVQDRTISVYDISREELGGFDLVLFLGVLYHLVHPTIGLEHAVQVADKLIIVEFGVHRDNPDDDVPRMYFSPGKYGGDPTNWWYPNPECVKEMMLTFGCSRVERIDRYSHKERPVLHGYKEG